MLDVCVASCSTILCCMYNNKNLSSSTHFGLKDRTKELDITMRFVHELELNFRTLHMGKQKRKSGSAMPPWHCAELTLMFGLLVKVI